VPMGRDVVRCEKEGALGTGAVPHRRKFFRFDLKMVNFGVF